MAHKNRRSRKCAIILCWLVFWHCIALAVDNKILLATPLETAEAFAAILGKGDFCLTVGRSLLRISAGFLVGFVVAVILAAGSIRYPLLEEALSPMVSLMKSAPVASFVVLLLIWWGSSFLAVAVCFLVTLPNIYLGVLEGLKSTDGQLLEMAQVFGLSFWIRFFYIYRPDLKPFLYAGLKVSGGMCWKAGVAAEVIGIPDYSIGERLYSSKIYLDTAGVFAWTAVVILLSVIFERLILWLTGIFFVWEPPCRKAASGRLCGVRRRTSGGGGTNSEEVSTAGERELRLLSVTKSFGGKTVLDRVDAAYEPGQIYFLTDPSGSGKTTRLHILAGLLKPDGGIVLAPGACSMVFQEDRLCEDYSAVKNVEIVVGSRREAEEALGRLLEREDLHKPCRQLSGGMKRRVALVRALEADSDYVLLDEPFAGMDAATRSRAEEYIRRRRNGRTVIIATHE